MMRNETKWHAETLAEFSKMLERKDRRQNIQEAIDEILAEREKLWKFVDLSFATEIPATDDEKREVILAMQSRIERLEEIGQCNQAALQLLHSESCRVSNTVYALCHGDREKRLAAMERENRIRQKVYAEECAESSLGAKPMLIDNPEIPRDPRDSDPVESDAPDVDEEEQEGSDDDKTD